MVVLRSGRFVYLLLLLTVLFATPLHAAESEQKKVVNGVAIYLGVLPAEMLLGPLIDSAGHEMHGGVPAGGYRYHIVVAVFDTQTGARIGNAQVKARVSGSDRSGPRKKLEPMLFRGTVTYGEYFSMPTSGPYKIEVEIFQPGKSAPVSTVFVYRFGKA